MRRLVEEDTNLIGHVHERSGVDDVGLRALYSHAQALIFPSLYEGFGMPLIEAQACGCPVFTSNRAPLTEIGGMGAGYVDPEQPEAAARFIAERLSEPGRRERMIQAGFENVHKRFTTDRMVDDYLKLYRTVKASESTSVSTASSEALKDRA
jgi:glycosyltransferase involved in cell wall biosynthesis